AERLQIALHSFQKLGARLDLARTEEALTALDYASPQRQNEVAGLLQLLTLRLTEAVASRELLLRELAAVIREETNAHRLLIAEPGEHCSSRVVVTYGWTEAESARLAEVLSLVKSEAERERLAATRNISLIALRPVNALPATVLVTPRD